MPGIPYDGFLGLSSLSNGINIRRTQNFNIAFSDVYRDFIDFIAAFPEKKIEQGSDGVNTWVNISLKYPKPFLLDGKSKDTVTASIADDLSGLLFFKMSLAYGEVVDGV